jgi:hypothetical protein
VYSRAALSSQLLVGQLAEATMAELEQALRGWLEPWVQPGEVVRSRPLSLLPWRF